MPRSDAYVCRIGYKDNPQGPGDYVELSSDDPEGMVFLGEPPFVWEDEPETIAFTKKGARPGNHATSILANNAKLTITVDLWATDPIALQAKIDKINTMLTQAKYRPVVVSLRLPNVGRMVLADVVAGQHIGPLNAQLSDATWLGNISRSLKIVVLCLPSTRDTRVTLDDRLINGDFANTINTTSNTGGVDGWTLGTNFDRDTTHGFYGPTCLKYTGQNTSGFSSSYTDFIPVSATAIKPGSSIVASGMMMGSAANAYGLDMKVQFYNGATFVSDNYVASIAAGAAPRIWETPFAKAFTIPSSGVTQIRFVIDVNSLEPASTQFYFDGIAIWNNTATLPVEYVAIPGNLYNPARIYGLQGTELALATLAFTPTTSAGATDLAGLIIAGLNPREAGGVYGLRGGMPALTDAPLPMCLAGSSTTNVLIGGVSPFTIDIPTQVDLGERVYSLWMRGYFHSPGHGGATSTIRLKAIIGNVTGLQGFVATQDTTITLTDASTAALISLGTLPLIPQESALSSPELAAESPVVPLTLRMLGGDVGGGSSGSDTLSVSELYCIRGDWGYGFAQISGNPFAPLAPNAGALAYVLDSSSGTMRVRGRLAGLPTTLNPLTSMTPLRLNPAPGLVNEVQLFYERQNQTDVPATDGYTLEVSYVPQRRAGT